MAYYGEIYEHATDNYYLVSLSRMTLPISVSQ